MGHQPLKSVEDKVRIVVAVLRGEVSVAEAARRAGVAEQTVHNWKNAFLEAGRAGLAGPSGAGRRENSNSRRRTRN